MSLADSWFTGHAHAPRRARSDQATVDLRVHSKRLRRARRRDETRRRSRVETRDRQTSAIGRLTIRRPGRTTMRRRRRTERRSLVLSRRRRRRSRRVADVRDVRRAVAIDV